MNDHIELKCWPEPFAATWDGRKTAEYRYDDRPYAVGARLVLVEYNPATAKYSGRAIVAEVTDVQHGPAWGIPDHYVLLSIVVHERIEAWTAF